LATIILSYRREDTELMVGRICDRLRDHYGRDSVMMDIDSIPYGLDFRKHIREALSRCDLMVAIIGPRWAALNEQGQSRLADDTDWIRIEIEAALAKDVPVIPVLVNGAAMPKTRELPETMQDLAFRQAAPLDMRRDFHTHMDRLIGVMDELLKLKADGESAAVEPSSAGTERGHAAKVVPQREPPQAAEIPKKKAEAPKAKVSSEPKIHPSSPRPPTEKPVNEPLAPADRPLLLRMVVPDAARRDAQSAVLAKNWGIVALRGALAVAVGAVWLLVDKGYLNYLDSESTQILAQIYVRSLLTYLLLDGALAIVSGWRGARPGERFVPLILNGLAELLLGGWVAMQRLGLVRVGEPVLSPTTGAPAAAAEPAVPMVSDWPSTDFWMDVGIGFIIAGALLLAASPGLNARYGRAWLGLGGIAWISSGIVFAYFSVGDYVWLSDAFAIAAGAAIFALAFQLRARSAS
jgi:hypothetical protein